MPIPLLQLLEFHSYFREELEELLTSPSMLIIADVAAILGTLDAEEKIPKCFKMADDLLCSLGQDYGFTPLQIEELRLLYLE